MSLIYITFIYTLILIIYSKDLSLLSSETRSVLANNQRLNPDIHFELWDDNDIDLFIQKEFNSNIYKAYRNIHRAIGAAKADFFRYCVIYRYGGMRVRIYNTLYYMLYYAVCTCSFMNALIIIQTLLQLMHTYSYTL